MTPTITALSSVVLLAACASTGNPHGRPPSDTAPPLERVGPASVQRIVAAFTAANVPILSTDASVVTTAPIARLTMTVQGETGANEYFVRATAGDAATLTLWARAVTRASARERPAEQGRCGEVPKCKEAWDVMRSVAAGLRSTSGT